MSSLSTTTSPPLSSTPLANSTAATTTTAVDLPSSSSLSSSKGWRTSVTELFWQDGRSLPSSTSRRRRHDHHRGTGAAGSSRPRGDDDDDDARGEHVAIGVATVRIPVGDVLDVNLLPSTSSSKDGGVPAVEVAARTAVADYVARTIVNVLVEEDRVGSDHPDAGMGEELPQQEQQVRQSSSLYTSFRIETLDPTSTRQDGHASPRNGRRLRRRRGTAVSGQHVSPYVLERTDIYCCHDSNVAADEDGNLYLYVNVRVLAFRHGDAAAASKERDAMNDNDTDDDDDTATLRELLAGATRRHMERYVQRHRNSDALWRHVATAVFQERLRHQLEHGNASDEVDLLDNKSNQRAVAFVANGSVLPRKNGNSTLPMASPPALPFVAPNDSPMTATVHVPMGPLARYVQLPHHHHSQNDPIVSLSNGSTVVSVTGLLIPRGVTLIVGGGYHGKSTLLRAISQGVYNKVPGDGREFCVTARSAVSIRAEDGRYVNNCNVSAFITNLPKIEPTTTGESKAAATTASDASSSGTPIKSNKWNAPTQHFSTGEASGSTSQAANVCEAIEMGATAMLVDEDVSAANFMARDGRMRSLVADESITPLLYRVNGMYSALGISSVVVVGGVGDWLDVPDAVILMQNYRCHDATAKARSISRQFSHGHVQYAGRGVVHRLPWDKSGSSVPLPVDAPPPKHTPTPRRPTAAFCQKLRRDRTAVRLLDGSEALALDPLKRDDDDVDGDGDSRMGGDEHTTKNVEKHGSSDDADQDDEDDDGEYVVDMSRCEQLVGKKMQLYGCGVCVLYVLELALQHPNTGLSDLLRMLDEHLDTFGIASLLGRSDGVSSALEEEDVTMSRLGFAYRPRRFEVGQALTRLRGIRLQEIELDDDGTDAAAAAALAEAERKKQELLDLWNSRRKK